MLDGPILIFNNSPLLPLFQGRDVQEVHVNFPPNVTIQKGTLLGLVTASGNDVQTLTIAGGPTGGTFTIAVTLSGVTQTTTAIAYNATPAAVQTALQNLSLLGSNVTVTGTAGTSYVLTFGGSLSNTPIPLVATAGSFTGGASPTITPVHTTVGSTAGTAAAYASGNSDGSQIPRAIAKFTVTTDVQGKITLGPQVGGGQWGEVEASAPAYFSGTFKTEDLIGLDANALTVWTRAQLLTGTIASGILRVA